MAKHASPKVVLVSYNLLSYCLNYLLLTYKTDFSLIMKNQDQWKPTKYIFKNASLVSSKNPNFVNPFSRLMADIVASYYQPALKKHAKGILLDLGCGKVPLYQAYQPFIEENICVDWTKSLHDSDHLDLECDLNEPLPFHNRYFDTVVLSDVLEHLYQPDALVLEIHRILKPGGHLIMNVPFLYWIHEGPHDYYRFTEFALKKYIEHSGLTLVQLEPIGGAFEVVADIFSKMATRIPFFKSTLVTLIQFFSSIFYQSRLGRTIKNSTAPIFPYGYFLVAKKPEGDPHQLECDEKP